MSFDFGEPKETDPTADFLAREREAAGVLSGDADLFGSAGGAGGDTDFERSASAFPALDDEGNPASPSQPQSGGGFGFDDNTEDAQPSDERQQFEKSFPELDDQPDDSPAYEAPTNGFVNSVPAPVQQTASYTAPAFGDDDDGEEPEAVK